MGAHLGLPKEQCKDLFNYVEEIITGQKPINHYPKLMEPFDSLFCFQLEKPM